MAHAAWDRGHERLVEDLAARARVHEVDELRRLVSSFPRLPRSGRQSRRCNRCKGCSFCSKQRARSWCAAVSRSCGSTRFGAASRADAFCDMAGERAPRPQRAAAARVRRRRPGTERETRTRESSRIATGGRLTARWSARAFARSRAPRALKSPRLAVARTSFRLNNSRATAIINRARSSRSPRVLLGRAPRASARRSIAGRQARTPPPPPWAPAPTRATARATPSPASASAGAVGFRALSPFV